MTLFDNRSLFPSRARSRGNLSFIIFKLRWSQDGINNWQSKTFIVVIFVILAHIAQVCLVFYSRCEGVMNSTGLACTIGVKSVPAIISRINEPGSCGLLPSSWMTWMELKSDRHSRQCNGLWKVSDKLEIQRIASRAVLSLNLHRSKWGRGNKSAHTTTTYSRWVVSMCAWLR